MKTLSLFRPYLVFLCVAFGLSVLLQAFPSLRDVFSFGMSGFYLSLVVLFVAGYGVHFIAPKTDIPVYVWAFLLGLALQVPLALLTANHNALLVGIELLASFILFAGGLHVPIKNFKKYFAPIAALSLVGTLLTVFFFALALSMLAMLYGYVVSALALLVLAAILSSIDPTTILSTLDRLHFRKPFLRDIAVSESAVNDVVGIVVTRFFLIAALGATSATAITVTDQFTPLLSEVALSTIALETLWGIMIGFLGAWILTTWGESVGKKHWSDSALFFVVPIFCFALGSLFGSAGFLAAFVAGLLFESKVHTKEVHLYFETLVDRFIKPIVFVLLGALVSTEILVSTIVIGAIAAIVFMFIIRPLVVFISLAPWMITKKALLNWREVLFLSFIRETGAIPAVLLLYAFASELVDIEFIFALGVWIMLYTLIIEPPLTQLLAKRLEVAK